MRTGAGQLWLIKENRACVSFALPRHRVASHFVRATFKSGCDTSRCQMIG